MNDVFTKTDDGGKYTRSQYFADKAVKLRNQFSDDRRVNLPDDQSNASSTLFDGVTIYINGWTNPSQYELKRLIALHGGKFEHYYVRAKVTHIIATNLPDSKVANNTDLTVHPNWILDSISHNKLLPVAEYILYKENPTLNKFLKPIVNNNKENSSSGEEIPPFVNNNESDDEEEEIFFPRPIMEKQQQQQMKTANDKNFMASYFESSRLHHLSLWRTEFQKELTDLIAASSQGGEKEKQSKERIVVHIDMDCFFASVAIKYAPELKGLPIAVCHSSNSEGTGDIASCNYEAREYGIRNGMWVRSAFELCPNLVVVPYQFDKYEEISKQFYAILLQYTRRIQAVSCDEALLELTDSNPMEIVKSIRQQILEKTGCVASAGVSHNILLARIACKKAKPNGQFFISHEEIEKYIDPLEVRDLPGVGWKMGKRLEAADIRTCKDLAKLSKAVLVQDYGAKTGETLYNFARGIDDRSLKLEQIRKSVAVDVNWGIRFTENEQATNFLREIAQELSKRLIKNKTKGKTIVLKLKKRREGAPEPAKYLGHGIADNLSKGKTLDFFTDDPDIIAREALELLKILNVLPQDMRGIGLHMQKLDNEKKKESPIKINPNQSIQKFLVSNKEKVVPSTTRKEEEKVTTPSSNLEPLPPYSQLDMAVLDKLPLTIKRELEIAYQNKEKAKKQKSDQPRSISLFSSTSTSVKRKEATPPPVVVPPTQSQAASPSPKEVDEKLAEFRKLSKVHTSERMYFIATFIDEWLSNEYQPEERISLELARYIEKLIKDKNMEEAYYLLNQFRSSTLIHTQWKEIFNSILDSTNVLIAKNYEGAHLSIEKIL